MKNNIWDFLPTTSFKQITEWHKKMEEARLQELRKGRELMVQKEEIRYLKNLVEQQERNVRTLEEDNVQQNTVRGKTTVTIFTQAYKFNIYK